MLITRSFWLRLLVMKFAEVLGYQQFIAETHVFYTFLAFFSISIPHLSSVLWNIFTENHFIVEFR